MLRKKNMLLVNLSRGMVFLLASIMLIWACTKDESNSVSPEEEKSLSKITTKYSCNNGHMGPIHEHSDGKCWGYAMARNQGVNTSCCDHTTINVGGMDQNWYTSLSISDADNDKIRPGNILTWGTAGGTHAAYIKLIDGSKNKASWDKIIIDHFNHQCSEQANPSLNYRLNSDGRYGASVNGKPTLIWFRNSNYPCSFQPCPEEDPPQPGKPILVGPANNRYSNLTNPVNFSWQIDNGDVKAKSYEVRVININNSANKFTLTDTYKSNGNHSKSSSLPLVGATYKWTVVAINDDETTSSDTWYFKMAGTTEEPPLPTVPPIISFGSRVNNKPNIIWSAVPNATGYKVYRITKANLQSGDGEWEIVANLNNPNATSFVDYGVSYTYVSNYSSKDVVYYKAKAYNSGGSSSYSNQIFYIFYILGLMF